MHQNLETYLLEISHYLPLNTGAEDIIAEIRSHIVEKSETEQGETTDERIARAIEKFGPPQDVAARYLDGLDIISPIFLRHLLLYTVILFVIHATLSLLASALRISLVGFPFLYIPRMDAWQHAFYLPMAFFYDLGLVTAFLYVVSHLAKRIRLPLPSLGTWGASHSEMPKPGVLKLLLLVLFFGVLMFFFFRFGTIFFLSLNDLLHPLPLFGPEESFYLSVVFLSMLGFQVLGYSARFVNRSRWLDVVAKGAMLLLLVFAWNSPMNVEFPRSPFVGLRSLMLSGLAIITIGLIYAFLRSLLLVSVHQMGTLSKIPLRRSHHE